MDGEPFTHPDPAFAQFGKIMYEQGRRDAIVGLLGRLEGHELVCALKMPTPLPFFCKIGNLTAKVFPDAVGKFMDGGWFFIARPDPKFPADPGGTAG
jgi:hypothetical protein